MPLNHRPANVNLQIAWPIVLLGALLGAVLAWGILSGDQQGRVNLLYLLLLYLVFPLLGVVVSTLSLIKGRGLNLARVITALPVWSNQKRMLLRKTRQLQVEKYWLFFQSHLAALAFSVSSVLVFFIMLLATDVNFVWRSTLLNPADLLPVLKQVALPWLFWPEAQPTIELLEATQDSRIQAAGQPGASYAGWWRFVLAIQLFYCVILRSGLLGITVWLFKAKLNKDIELTLSKNNIARPVRDAGAERYRPVASGLPQGITINNWAAADLDLLADYDSLELSAENILKAGPLASEAEQDAAENWRDDQVILVKSWEPPMGELADFMQTGKGYIWPIDWQDAALVPLRGQHLQEWRRFVNNMPDWQVYLPVGLMPLEA